MTIYKRIGSFILSLLLVFSMFGSTFAIQTFAAASPALSAESKTVSAGEQFTVAVSLANATTVYGGNFTLQYDSSLLTADSYEFSSIVSGHTKNCNLNYQSAGNLIRVTFSGASAVTSSGTLITFTFTAKENVSGSAALQFNAYKMYDENGSAITSTASGSAITISSGPVVTPAISVTSKTVTVGDTVSVPIVITNSSEVYGGNFTLQYDSTLLTADSYSFGSIVSGHTKNCNLNYQSAGNLIRVTFSGADAVSSDGTLVTFTFTAKASGTATLQFNAYKMYDENGTSIDTTVSNGNVTINTKPDIDTTKPTVSITSTNNVSEYQTVTLKMTDDVGVVSYYFGTSSSPHSSWYTSVTSSTSVIETSMLSIADTWYLIAKDAAGNTSSTSLTFYETTLDANGGSVSPSYVITASGNTVTLPTPTNGNATFIGWGTSATATSGVKSVSPTSSKTYYAIWENIPKITLSSNNITLKVGETNNITATTIPSGQTVIWTSSNTSVATVSKGSITGFSEGTATITAKFTYDGISYLATCDVTVISNVPSCLSYTITDGEVTITDCSLSESGSLTIPDTIEGYPVKYIGKSAFSNVSWITDITIPNSVISIEENAFYNCSQLSSITIPSSVTSIGESAFDNCKSLKSIVIPKGVTTIGRYAFLTCTSLTSVTISESVTNIGYNAFLNCDSLENIIVDEDNAYYSSIDGVLFNKNMTELLRYPSGKTADSYIIPNGVTVIDSYAFDDSVYIETITMPSSITYISDYTFDECIAFTDVYFKGSEDEWNSITVDRRGNDYLENATIHYNYRAELTEISISSNPTKTTYYVGDIFDSDGLALKLTFSDGTTEIVTSGFTISGFSSATAGTKTVAVSYEGFTDTFTVTVTNAPAPTPTTLTVSSKPTKITYEIGESLNTSGLKLKLTYSDGTYETITSGFTTSGFSSTTTGTKTVTVKYSGLTTTFTVTVTSTPDPTPTSLSVSTKPTKTTYEIGESLNTSGLKLKLTYSDGSTETITNGFTTSGFSSTTAGTKTVTVKYSGLTTTFTVTVNPAPVPDDLAQLVMSSSEIMAGKEITLTLALKNNPGIAGMTVSFKYDENVLTLKDSKNGGLFSGFTAAKNFAWDESENVTDDGVLATFTFAIAENAPAGEYGIEVIVRSCTNEDLDDVELLTTNGIVSVIDFVYGDSNGDNKIDIKDVVLLRKYITNFDYDTNTSSVNVELGADANGDDKIDIKDVVILRKYITNYDYDTESSTVILGPQ